MPTWGKCVTSVAYHVAWGDECTIRERLAEQFTAGATHVCMIPLDPRGSVRPDQRAIDALAPR